MMVAADLENEKRNTNPAEGYINLAPEWQQVTPNSLDLGLTTIVSGL